MTAAAETIHESDHHRRCGCCGRQLPLGQVVELGQTPGVFICAGCALWAARRAGPLSALRHLRPPALPLLLPRFTRRKAEHSARTAIPILISADLDRTAAFYAPVGFTETERYDGYLLLHIGGVELHFSHQPDAAPGQCFLHVRDALKLWKELRDHGMDGVGPIADQEYGLREFVITDPDGNHVRVGSPTH
jgi:hypothetical protein